MNIKARKTFFSLLLFLLIAGIIFSVSIPLYSGISHSLKSVENRALEYVKNQYGISISYRSLSPSVLSSLHVKDIVLSSVDTGEEILVVKKAVFSYRISKLLKKDWKNAFTRLSVSDIYLELSDEFIIKLTAALNVEKKEPKAVLSSQEKYDEFITEIFPKIKTVSFSLPFDVSLKNINFSFTVKESNFNLSLRDVSIKKESGGTVLNSSVSGAFLAAFSQDLSFGFRFRLFGNILNVFDGSSFRLVLDENPRASVSVARIDNLLRYEDGVFLFRSIQNLYPYNISADFAVNAGDFSLTLDSADLDPLSLIRFSKQNKIVDLIKGTLFSTDSDFNINFKTLEYSWKTDSGLVASKNISQTGQTLDLNLSGDNDFVNINSISAEGDIAGLLLSAVYDIKNREPSGFLELRHFNLPNGNVLSFDLYCEPEPLGFLCFIPQLSFNDFYLSGLSLNALFQNNSVGFSFEATDLSHVDYDEPGILSLDGSVDTEKGIYISASASVENLFLDSILKIVYFFTEKKSGDGNKTIENFAPYIASTDFYVSTDLKSITFNSPYLLCANTKKDREFLFLSFDGSESTVSVSQLEVMYGTNTLQASFQADILAEDKEIVFNTDFNLNNIPYTFNGVFAIGNYVSVSGDYGLRVNVDLSKKPDGSMEFISFPLSAGGYTFALSSSAEFNFSSPQDFEISIKNFEISELTTRLRTHPKLILNAKADENGIVVSSLDYSDTVSAINGSGYALWNVQNSIFENMNVDFNLSGDIGRENFHLYGTVTNPMQNEFSSEDFIKNCFYSLQAEIKYFAMGHLFNNQAEDDTLSANITATGNFESPYVNIELENVSLQLADAPLIAKGSASLVEGLINVNSFNADWGIISLKDLNASVDLSNFVGNASSVLNVDFNKKYLELPVALELENLSPEEESAFVPESFSLKAVCSNVKGNLLKDLKSFSATVLRTPGRWDFFTDEILGLFGSFEDSGLVNLSVAESKKAHFDMVGRIGSEIDVNISNLFIDVGYFAYIFNHDFVSFYKGIATGNIHMTGLLTDPNFDGAIHIEDVDFNSPVLIPEHFSTKYVDAQLIQNELVIPETVFNIKSGILHAAATIKMDRWAFGGMNIDLESEKGHDIPVDLKIPFVRVKGWTSVEGNIFMEESDLLIRGDFVARNAEVSVLEHKANIFEEIMAGLDGPSTVNYTIDLNLIVGQKVYVAFNPLVRGLVSPGTPINFDIDSNTDSWSIKSDINLKGGEVTYLNRNFYLKEGRVILNESKSNFDPTITLRAETREHDENGESVTIILSAIRQKLSTFKATLSSTPAKSETEILSLLGQVVTGDSSDIKNFILSGVDYGVQITLLRKLENSLRDLCNFDIFSVRTTLLQNTIKQGFNINTDAEKGTGVSNLFDNSTVYIGKYFGKSIYADALMHWTYDETRAEVADSGGGLVFQPEIGLELESPFANIRWSFAPDLGELQQSWVPSTSITLSWRISF